MEELREEKDPLTAAAGEFFGLKFLYPFQRLAVHNILSACGYRGSGGEEESPGDQIVILPTGAGKSLCFQLPAALLPGLTVVVYPLLSLMADQERRLADAAIACGILRGGQTEAERGEIMKGAASGRIKLILTNPETLLTAAGRIEGLAIVHLVVDEAHCVAEWGESFRPAYLGLGEVRKKLKPRVTTAFTATASPPVLERVAGHLYDGKMPHLISADPDRPNIRYRVLPVLSKDEALAALLRLPENSHRRPAVVFCRSRSGAEMTARTLRLRLREEDILFYHAGLEKEEKKRIERRFLLSRRGILAATCAYGLGIDKPDIRTVVHRDVPGSVEAYLQESGRGGRDKEPAEAVLLWSAEDPERLSGLADEYSRTRYRAMLDYRLSRSCRRRGLLSLLGRELETCSGCDICDGTALLSPPEEGTILRFVGRNRRRYTKEETALILSGVEDFRAKTRELTGVPGFGGLGDFSEAGVLEAVLELERTGKIRRISLGPWKGLLTLP